MCVIWNSDQTGHWSPVNPTDPGKQGDVLTTELNVPPPSLNKLSSQFRLACFPSNHSSFICMPSLFHHCKCVFFPSIPTSCWPVTRQPLAWVCSAILSFTLVTATIIPSFMCPPELFMYLCASSGTSPLRPSLKRSERTGTAAGRPGISHNSKARPHRSSYCSVDRVFSVHMSWAGF